MLSAIVDRIEGENFGGLSTSVLAKARDEEEKEIIKACLGNMRNRCDVVTAVRRCAPYAYATESVSTVPTWWSSLTVSRWNELLDESDDSPEPDGELTIECTNALISHLRGLVPVAKSSVQLRLRASEEQFGRQILVKREVPGSKGATKEWILAADRVVLLEDDEIPGHKSPIKYSASFLHGNGKKRPSVSSHCRAGSLVWW
ncbi:hypothetical protein [Arenimonas daejeonensis]|uniref:hypothetical protein n=1 Tax=Arenimonas daejeonensis TaxID=370777 RepID=UPI0011BEC02E|nr:hypothetical protein [Arenimonas daejeonensis]